MNTIQTSTLNIFSIFDRIFEYKDYRRAIISVNELDNKQGGSCSKIDLMHYCDRGPLTVHPHTTVARAYSVFRKLGLRHLPVIARNGKSIHRF